MGFFGDMGSIRKIYNLLAEIEQGMFAYMAHTTSLQYVMNNYESLKNKKTLLVLQLRTLKSMYEQASDTVKCADFQFKGHKLRLAEIIRVVTEDIQRASLQIENLHRM